MTSFLNSTRRALLAVPLFMATVSAEAADDVAATAGKSAKLNQIAHLLRVSGLEDGLRKSGTYTIFAPTDEAFGKLPRGVLFRLLQPENKQWLTAVLNYHIVPGDYPTERLAKAKAKQFNLKTADGSNLEVDIRSGIKAASATAGQGEMKASNGVVIPIDTVLIPPKIKAAMSGRPLGGS